MIQVLRDSARHYSVVPADFAFVVAYENARGEPIAVSEHGSAASAAQEARRLNTHRAASSSADESAFGLHDVSHRRTARHFDADTFA